MRPRLGGPAPLGWSVQPAYLPCHSARKLEPSLGTPPPAAPPRCMSTWNLRTRLPAHPPASPLHTQFSRLNTILILLSSPTCHSSSEECCFSWGGVFRGKPASRGDHLCPHSHRRLDHVSLLAAPPCPELPHTFPCVTACPLPVSPLDLKGRAVSDLPSWPQCLARSSTQGLRE